MDRVVTEAAIIVSDMTLVPVVRYRQQRHNNHRFIASKEPLAIIICDRNGVQAIDTCSSSIEISELLNILPELETTLEQLNCKRRSQ